MAGKKQKPTTALFLLTTFLIAVGKPFYFIFSRVFIALAFVFYIVFSNLKKIKLPQRKVNKIVYPKFNFSLPKINIHLRLKKLHLALIVFFILLVTIYLVLLKDLPSPKDLTTRQVDVSTKIYDRNGILLYTIYKDKNRTPVTLSQVPESLRLATLAAEDAEFYNHVGFSLRGMMRALGKNLSEGKLQGGSTITQQLVKNALLSSEKTYVRKIRELILSIGVEMYYSKDEILEMYLNEVSYGGTIYGVQEAAWHYFNKNVEELSLSEAALIAGLPQSPTRYSPFGNNPDLTFSRQREVLYLMKINKYITSEMEEEATAKRITFALNRQKILAPHFVMFVREKLIEEFGEEVVLKGGLNVTTTLDLNIQLLAEEVAKEEIEKLKNLNVTNVAVVVMDPNNGDILAMVGSKDYFDTKNGGNVNVTTRLRQPGSSIKIVNYASALAEGLTLASIVDDSPITFNIAGQKPYIPQNYDGTFKGKITVRQALAQSRNIPAIKILASQGVNKMIDLGEKMGITTWEDRSRFGLSLTLGGGEAKLIDMAQVYSVIANMGKKSETKYVSEIKNHEGKNIYNQNRFETDKKEVIDPRIAFLLIDALKDNIARSPAFGSTSMLVIPNHPEVAVKTGTSNNLRDNLAIGFNKDYVVAVWVGNNDGSSMNRVASGITGSSPIWNKIMKALLLNEPSIPWTPPDGLVYKECYSRYEWFLEEKQLNCPKIIEPAVSTISN